MASPVKYTRLRIKELARCAVDPIYFIEKYCKCTINSSLTNIKLYDFQKRLITNLQHDSCAVINSARQMGKTLVITLFMLWFAIFHADEVVRIANFNQSTVNHNNRIIQTVLSNLPDWILAKTSTNGSSIRCEVVSDIFCKGEQVTKLFVDEFACVNPDIQGEFLVSMLYVPASIIVASTPSASDVYFREIYKSAEEGITGFLPITLKWDEHPDRDENFKSEMICFIGQTNWDIEYEAIL